MNKDEAMKLALEALEVSTNWDMNATGKQAQSMKAITVLRRALAEQPAQQEPVAWMHTKLDGVVVPHRPADLDKHPDRWEALYRTPPPCPTCEALARTVMLDQTYHDNISPQRPWQGLTDEDWEWVADKKETSLDTFAHGAAWAADRLKEKNT